MKRWLIALLTPIVLLACKPTFDTSSDQALEESTKKVMEDMNEQEKKELSKAILVITFQDGLFSNENAVDDAMKQIDGLTSDEVIELAEKIKAEHKK